MNQLFLRLFEEIKKSESKYLDLTNRFGYNNGDDVSLLCSMLVNPDIGSEVYTLDLTNCIFTDTEFKMIIDVLPQTNIIILKLKNIQITRRIHALNYLLDVLPQTKLIKLNVICDMFLEFLEKIIDILPQTKLISLDYPRFYIDNNTYEKLDIPLELIAKINLYFHNQHINSLTLIQILNKYNSKLEINKEFNRTHPPFRSKNIIPIAKQLSDLGLLVSGQDIKNEKDLIECYRYLEQQNIYILNKNVSNLKTYEGGFFVTRQELETDFDKWHNFLSELVDDIKIRYQTNLSNNYFDDIAIVKDGNDWKVRNYIRHFGNTMNFKIYDSDTDVPRSHIEEVLKPIIENILFVEMEMFENNVIGLPYGLLNTVLAGIMNKINL